MSKVFKYILDFQAQTDKFGKDVGGMQGMLKGAAIAAGAFFAADKIMDAADAVADYAQEISRVRNEVATLTGLQGGELNKMTGQVQAIASAYDADVSGALKASNLVMQQFGTDSKATFDIINAGMASAANANDDFLEQVSEYAPHYKEAGLAADEMVAIMAAGAKQGVFNDKTSDTIKEGSIRLREMTQSTKDALNAIGLSADQVQADISSGNQSMFEVMQLVSRQLKTLPEQSPAVGAALADIFGGPGEDAVQFIRTLADVDTSMGGIISGADEATTAQLKWADELAEFHTIGAQVFGGTSTMFTNVKTAALDMANNAIKGIVGIINYFIDLYNESMIFRGAIQYIKLGFEQIWDSVKLVFNLIWENLKTIGNLIKGVFTLDIGTITEAIKTGFTGAVDAVKQFGKNNADNYMEAWNNTLNPKKKIELISLSASDAAEAGAEAGKAFATGVQTGAASVAAGGTVALPARVADNSMGGFKQSKTSVTIETEASVEGLADLSVWMDDATQKANNFKRVIKDEVFSNLSNRIGIMAQSFGSLGSSIGGVAGEWLNMAGNVLGMIPTLISQIAALTAAQVSSSAATTAAKSSEAMASGIAASQSVPFPLNLIALAATVAAIGSAIANVTKLADGGIASSPTYALIGEYPGAASNPEVVAPLSKLKSMIGEQRGGGSVTLQPSIAYSGDRFRVFLNKVDGKVNKRTGRRN